MSLPDQVIKHYTNASGVALVRGQIVRAAAGIRQATTALADMMANVVGVLGVVDGGGASINGGFNIAITGNAHVLLEAGLVAPAGGDRIFISATTAGRGTNVAPATEVEIGVIADASRYSIDETVEATLYGAFAPGNGGSGATAKFVWDYFAGQGMIDTIASAWPTSVSAPNAPDAISNAMDSRGLIHTAVTGYGMQFDIPAGVANCKIRQMTRGTGTGGNRVSIIRARAMGDNSAADAFAAAVNLNAFVMPATTAWQYDEQTLTLAAIGSLTAGERGQMQLTRDQVGTVLDTLATTVFDYHTQLIFS